MEDYTFDAIVIGSGISGGWAAKELTEKGLKVAMLERGMNIEHVRDYPSANKGLWEFPHRGGRTQQMIKDYPVLRRDYPLNEKNLDWWVNEKESPYSEVKRFDWYRGYHVGGRSLLWGRQTYRFSDLDFSANAKDGVAVDWPVRYDDIKPWYEYVERHIGVSGTVENMPQLPDSVFLPEMKLTAVEKQIASQIGENFEKTRRLIPARVAHHTKQIDPNRSTCQYRNKCSLGCPFGGYFSTQSSTLPAAMSTGNLTLRPWSIVTKILYDKDTKKATGVEVLDAQTNKIYEYKSKIIFLNASTLNSTWLLKNSATDVWEGGLGSSSGELGHNLMDHHFKIGATGEVEGFEDRTTYGRRPGGFYIPRYRNFENDKRDYLRGFGYQGGSGRDGWNRPLEELSIGADFKEKLCTPGGWSVGMTGFGEMLPYHENKVTLNHKLKDKWGLNTLSIDCEFKDNEMKMRKDMENDAVEMLEKAGVKNVKGYNNDCAPGMGIHEMGTARMGKEAKTSVLNKWNQVWDAKNVFVTDGSFMTSASCVNPSLTYMAFTARAANYAVEELKKGNL